MRRLTTTIHSRSARPRVLSHCGEKRPRRDSVGMHSGYPFMAGILSAPGVILQRPEVMSGSARRPELWK
jgi:hypothetical protein